MRRLKSDRIDSRMIWRTYKIQVARPFRLDLTVNALRRLPTNIVDLLTPEGDYVRALSTKTEPVIFRVAQINPETLLVGIDGDRHRGEEDQMLRLVQKVLGTERDLSEFDVSAAKIPWLSPLVQRMCGVKPPRYPTLWEACVNAVVFQQLSIRAASAIMRRLIATLGQRVETDSIPVSLHVFPSAERLNEAPEDVLRATGLSASKAATLRRLADAIMSGTLDAEKLEEGTSQDVITALCSIKGIGPWTAAIILLRGLGRLDVFPENDSGVASNIAMLSAGSPSDPRHLLDTLGAQRGMLYFYLLLARLETTGEINRPSFERRQQEES